MILTVGFDLHSCLSEQCLHVKVIKLQTMSTPTSFPSGDYKAIAIRALVGFGNLQIPPTSRLSETRQRSGIDHRQLSYPGIGSVAQSHSKRGTSK